MENFWLIKYYENHVQPQIAGVGEGEITIQSEEIAMILSACYPLDYLEKLLSTQIEFGEEIAIENQNQILTSQGMTRILKRAIELSKIDNL